MLADLFFFFHVVAGRPNGIKSARPSVFHIMLQKKNMGMKRESLKGKGDDLLLYWFTYGKWMNGRSWFDAFVVESLFYVDCVPQQDGEDHPTPSHYRREVLQDEKRGDEEPPSLVRYLHVSQAELRKPHTHTAINRLASVLPVICDLDPCSWAESLQRPAQPIRRLAPLLPAMIFFTAQQR